MRKRRKKKNQDDMMLQSAVGPMIKHPGCILEALEIISERANGSHLTEDFFKSVEGPCAYLKERLDFTPQQSVMFSLLMEQSEDTCIQLGEIGEITGCGTIKMLRFSKSLEDLSERYYVRIRSGRSCDSYRIPRAVIISLRDDIPYVQEKEEIMDVNEFFDLYKRLLRERKADEISYEKLRKYNEDNLEQIADTHFARLLKQELSDADDRLLFVHMTHHYLSFMNDYIDFNDISQIFDENDLPINLKRELRGQGTQLQVKLIENSNSDGMAQPDNYRLTEYAKNNLLSEVRMNEILNTSHDLKKHDSLPEKMLVFNEKESEQISQLSSLLMPERFGQIQDNLEKAGMRRGFCCLLYGAPGTGKTETVYQLARKTGRDILQVNVDQIKSCWVGESEKNMKQLFDRYRTVCKDSTTIPILLFNEADAVLGLRKKEAVSAVDKMENSIQNIILQEMESLEGIMIATTNLTENLDKAFERRFLYKIKYEMPDTESRCKIWMQMLKGLTQKDARTLASRFNLSGGEIENIIRKHTVSSILAGTDILDIDTLIKLCEQERLQTGKRVHVGF